MPKEDYFIQDWQYSSPPAKHSSTANFRRRQDDPRHDTFFRRILSTLSETGMKKSFRLILEATAEKKSK
jgi:hypothetical protein